MCPLLLRMRITSLASQINVALGNQLTPQTVLEIMDGVQKSAYQRNIDAFLVYNRRVEIMTALAFATTGYTAPSDDDIGTTITGETSGATAVLRSFDASTREWYVADAGTFTPGERVCTVSGGRGTLQSQEVWKGPYEAPSDCRKIWGITRREPGRFNFRDSDSYQVDGTHYTGDYGLPSSVGKPFEGGQVNDLEKTFLFATPPSLTAKLWWVFWREAPDLDFNDDRTLTIPAAYNTQFVSCCVAAGNATLSGTPFDDDVVERYLGGWLDSLRAPYRDQRGGANMTRDNLV